MTKWAPFLAAVAIAASPCSAAVLVYELRLVAENPNPYTVFGGGTAGDTFIGTFGFDDALVGSPGPGGVFDPILSENAFFLSISLNGTNFSTATPGATLDNRLRFNGGPLLDVYFDIINPNGDRLEVGTDVTDPSSSFWIATEDSSQNGVGGGNLEESIYFALIPEPATTTLAGLGTLLLLRRRRR